MCLGDASHLSDGVGVRSLWVEGAIHVLAHVGVGYCPQRIHSDQNSALGGKERETATVQTAKRGGGKANAALLFAPKDNGPLSAINHARLHFLCHLRGLRHDTTVSYCSISQLGAQRITISLFTRRKCL